MMMELDEALIKILKSRLTYNKPYSVTVKLERSHTEIVDWLKEYCTGEFNYQHFGKRKIYFEKESDLILFQLTWG